MATKYSIAEQVLLRLKAGRIDQATKVDIRDIMMAVPQAVNETIKAQHFSMVLPSGETIPDGTVLATYENVPVESWKNVSRAKLPAIPISLPRGMGIYMISRSDDPNCLFIPALPGQVALLNSQAMINPLFGNYAYEPYGQWVQFNKNLIADAITTVMMRLLVSDVSGLSDFDVLPIPADYEAGVIDMVFQRFAVQGSADMDSDVLTNNNTGQ